MSLFKSSYQVERLDCPSEEQMIRLKMEGLEAILCISVDIQQRRVSVIHRGEVEPVSKALSELGLGSRFESSEKVDTDTTEESRYPKTDSVVGAWHQCRFLRYRNELWLIFELDGADRRLARHASRRHRLRVELNGCRHCSQRPRRRSRRSVDFSRCY